MSLLFSASAYELFERPMGDRTGEVTAAQLPTLPLYENLTPLSKTQLPHEQRLLDRFLDRTDFDALPFNTILAGKMGIVGKMTNMADKQAVLRTWGTEGQQLNREGQMAGRTPSSQKQNENQQQQQTATNGNAATTMSAAATVAMQQQSHSHSPATSLEDFGQINLTDADRFYRRACVAPRTLSLSKNGTLYICDELGDLVLEAFPVKDDVVAIKTLLSLKTRALDGRELEIVREQHAKDAGMAWGGIGRTHSASASSASSSQQQQQPSRFGTDFETIRRIDAQNTVDVPLEEGEVGPTPTNSNYFQNNGGDISRAISGFSVSQNPLGGGGGIGIGANGQAVPTNSSSRIASTPAPPPLMGFQQPQHLMTQQQNQQQQTFLNTSQSQLGIVSPSLSYSQQQQHLHLMTPPPPARTKRLTFLSSLLVEMNGVSIVVRHFEPLPTMPPPLPGFDDDGGEADDLPLSNRSMALMGNPSFATAVGGGNNRSFAAFNKSFGGGRASGGGGGDAKSVISSLGGGSGKPPLPTLLTNGSMLLSRARANTILGKSFAGIEAMLQRQAEEEAMRQETEVTEIEMFTTHRFIFPTHHDAQKFIAAIKSFTDPEIFELETIPVNENRGIMARMNKQRDDILRRQQEHLDGIAAAKEEKRVKKELKKLAVLSNSGYMVTTPLSDTVTTAIAAGLQANNGGIHGSFGGASTRSGAGVGGDRGSRGGGDHRSSPLLQSGGSSMINGAFNSTQRFSNLNGVGSGGVRTAEGSISPPRQSMADETRSALSYRSDLTTNTMNGRGRGLSVKSKSGSNVGGVGAGKAEDFDDDDVDLSAEQNTARRSPSPVGSNASFSSANGQQTTRRRAASGSPASSGAKEEEEEDPILKQEREQREAAEVNVMLGEMIVKRTGGSMLGGFAGSAGSLNNGSEGGGGSVRGTSSSMSHQRTGGGGESTMIGRETLRATNWAASTPASHRGSPNGANDPLSPPPQNAEQQQQNQHNRQHNPQQQQPFTLDPSSPVKSVPSPVMAAEDHKAAEAEFADMMRHAQQSEVNRRAATKESSEVLYPNFSLEPHFQHTDWMKIKRKEEELQRMRDRKAAVERLAAADKRHLQQLQAKQLRPILDAKGNIRLIEEEQYQQQLQGQQQNLVVAAGAGGAGGGSRTASPGSSSNSPRRPPAAAGATAGKAAATVDGTALLLIAGNSIRFAAKDHNGDYQPTATIEARDYELLRRKAHLNVVYNKQNIPDVVVPMVGEQSGTFERRPMTEVERLQRQINEMKNGGGGGGGINKGKSSPTNQQQQQGRHSPSPQQQQQRSPNQRQQQQQNFFVDPSEITHKNNTDVFLNPKNNRINLHALAASIPAHNPQQIARDATAVSNKISLQAPYPHFSPKFGTLDHQQHKYTVLASRQEQIEYDSFTKPQIMYSLQGFMGDQLEGRRWRNQQDELDKTAIEIERAKAEERRYLLAARCGQQNNQIQRHESASGSASKEATTDATFPSDRTTTTIMTVGGVPKSIAEEGRGETEKRLAAFRRNRTDSSVAALAPEAAPRRNNVANDEEAEEGQQHTCGSQRRRRSRSSGGGHSTNDNRSFGVVSDGRCGGGGGGASAAVHAQQMSPSSFADNNSVYAVSVASGLGAEAIKYNKEREGEESDFGDDFDDNVAVGSSENQPKMRMDSVSASSTRQVVHGVAAVADDLSSDDDPFDDDVVSNTATALNATSNSNAAAGGGGGAASATVGRSRKSTLSVLDAGSEFDGLNTPSAGPSSATFVVSGTAPHHLRDDRRMSVVSKPEAEDLPLDDEEEEDGEHHHSSAHSGGGGPRRRSSAISTSIVMASLSATSPPRRSTLTPSAAAFSTTSMMSGGVGSQQGPRRDSTAVFDAVSSRSNSTTTTATTTLSHFRRVDTNANSMLSGASGFGASGKSGKNTPVLSVHGGGGGGGRHTPTSSSSPPRHSSVFGRPTTPSFRSSTNNNKTPTTPVISVPPSSAAAAGSATRKAAPAHNDQSLQPLPFNVNHSAASASSSAFLPATAAGVTVNNAATEHNSLSQQQLRELQQQQYSHSPISSSGASPPPHLFAREQTATIASPPPTSAPPPPRYPPPPAHGHTETWHRNVASRSDHQQATAVIAKVKAQVQQLNSHTPLFDASHRQRMEADVSTFTSEEAARRQLFDSAVVGRQSILDGQFENRIEFVKVHSPRYYQNQNNSRFSHMYHEQQQLHQPPPQQRWPAHTSASSHGNLHSTGAAGDPPVDSPLFYGRLATATTTKATSAAELLEFVSPRKAATIEVATVRPRWMTEGVSFEPIRQPRPEEEVQRVMPPPPMMPPPPVPPVATVLPMRVSTSPARTHLY